MKIYLAQINTTVGDIEGNAKKILLAHDDAKEKKCDLVIFCEMSICGYPCEDLWKKKYFIEACQDKILEISNQTKNSNCAIILGCPWIEKSNQKKEFIYNSALLIHQGKIEKLICKKSLPNFGIFDEARYFDASNYLSVIKFQDMNIAILICEDIWDKKNLFLLQEKEIDFVIAINSSPYSTKKQDQRLEIAKDFVDKLSSPFVYLNQVGGQDGVVFDGDSFVMDDSKNLILQLENFQEDFGIFEINKEIISTYDNREIRKYDDLELDYKACILALRDYLYKNSFKKVLLGMSGGIDSALVATMACDAIGSENVDLYALPSQYSSESSMLDATNCANNLNVKLQVISIVEIFEEMKKSIANLTNLAKENLQSRIRGNILMAISNSSNSLLLSTGNKSELSCGYATIYGDMCGAFNPIKDIYKTRIYQLANWRNSNIPNISLLNKLNVIPQNILTKEPTAELRPNQKDSDSLPDYKILDQILFSLIEEEKSVKEVSKNFDEELVKNVANLFYGSEYKRKQSVIGTKISNMSFDKDRRYPLTNKFKI